MLASSKRRRRIRRIILPPQPSIAPKDTLVTDKLDENIAEKQAKAVNNKAKAWRAYLSHLADDLNANSDFYLHRMASLWASTFSYIEWLAVFKLYKTFPNKNEIAEILRQSWGWEKEIGVVFWAAGRHPVAHVGQTNTFYSFEDYDGLPTNVSFDSQNRWSEAVTGEWDKYHPYKAVAVLPALEVSETKTRIITFFHQMLLAELLPKLADDIVDQIANESDHGNLRTIYELNKQILH